MGMGSMMQGENYCVRSDLTLNLMIPQIFCGLVCNDCYWAKWFTVRSDSYLCQGMNLNVWPFVNRSRKAILSSGFSM